MLHQRKFFGSMVTTIMLLLSNLYIAQGVSAHQEYAGSQPLHWHKGGTAIHISITDYAAHHDEAEAAIYNHYGTITLLYWDRVTPSEVYVFDGDYGAIGQCGITAFSYDPGTGHLYHVDSKYNDNPSTSCGQSDPGFIQGIFCQEIGHAWGQDHHAEGGSCMGLTYFPGAGDTLSSHDNDDFTAWYRCHLGC